MKNNFTLCGSIVCWGLLFSTPSLARTFVYVSEADDGTIARYTLDEENGALQLSGRTNANGKVMPMVVSPDKRHLYAAIRSQPLRISGWRIDSKTGALTPTTETPAAASYPYISIDKKGRFLLAASYDGGVAHVYRINKSGIVASPCIAEYQTGHAAHSIITDATNRSVYIGSLGTDRVLQLNLQSDGKLTPIAAGFVKTAEKNGPRHSVLSPDNRFLYNIGEMGGVITQFKRLRDGALKKVADYPSAVAEKYQLQHGVERPAGFSDTTPRIWAADINITPDNRFLYVSERTSSTVSGYRIAQDDGRLTLTGTWPVEKQPRGMAVTADGRWLVVSGEKSRVVSSYAINTQSGELVHAGEAPSGRDANWVTIVSY
ncbi:beta-propeller fold lactonase family protein [Erwinia sp. 9145]|uniref:lactonase family protein n=1 Tax=Erwinia sp. 9145 TaxID=1500895 RepID=UPI00068FFA3A|nr:beta-propeller fold lactonase family protein [Erwinia sp. 9145]